MKSKLLVIGVLLLSAGRAPASETATGIPVDNLWKRNIYDFAKKNVVHPAWGLAHSERDYQMTKILARAESIEIDDDVLFAASFLHDVGGIAPFAKSGVDHALRSVEVIEPLLPAWGFPMSKWPKVKEMILGHTYYGWIPESAASRAFRDADVLDFLGHIGIARILATTEERGHDKAKLSATVGILKGFTKTMPEKCLSKTCRELAVPREKEMKDYLDVLSTESFGETAL